MAAKTVGVSPVALTGFEGLHRSRKKRIEALLRRLIGLVNGKGWALGLFDVDGDLVDYDVSQSGIGGAWPFRSSARCLFRSLKDRSC